MINGNKLLSPIFGMAHDATPSLQYPPHNNVSFKTTLHLLLSHFQGWYLSWYYHRQSQNTWNQKQPNMSQFYFFFHLFSTEKLESTWHQLTYPIWNYKLYNLYCTRWCHLTNSIDKTYCPHHFLVYIKV